MFFRKKIYQQGASPGKLAWQKFFRDKLAITFVGVVVLAIIVAVLGYLISPDNTPFANAQYLEYAARTPGFKAHFVAVAKNEVPEKTGFFSKMAYGSKSHFTMMPYDSLRFEEDMLVIAIATGDTANRLIENKVRLADVVYHLMPADTSYAFDNGIITFRDYTGSIKSDTPENLIKIINNKHIISKRFLLGTDRLGRDVLSRIMIGTRVSLSVGFISVFISLLIGITLGAAAGYFKGWIDTLIVWFINVIWSIPTLLLVIAITFALGKGFWQIFIAVGLTMWVEVARVVRGQVLSLREKEFIEATKALGYGSFRTIFRHILPNVIGPVIVISAANFASAILIEAGLSFLGIGVQPPMPSWGTMIKEHYNYIILNKAFLAVIPGIAIMLMVMAFMVIGNSLRDALDVRTVNGK